MAYDVKALQATARQRFPESDYVHVADCCEFIEHETQEHTVANSDGSSRKVPARKYDRAALELIAENCNRRIANTGSFAVLADGHTGKGDEPETLGYAGPFRVERVGNEEPVWAIVGDEWHLKDSVPRLRRRPRRSVELWIGEDGPAKAFFDPIATLGSETPRLEMPPVLYSLAHDPESGREVLRYQAVSPSAGNVFVPSTDALGDKEKDTYGMEDRDEALVAKVLAAIAEMPAMKWAAEQSAKAEAVAETNEADSATSEDMPNEAVPSPEEASAPEADGSGTDAAPLGEDAPEVEPDREKETYTAEESPLPSEEEEEEPVVPSNAERQPKEVTYTMLYSKDPVIERMQREFYSLKAQVEARDRRDADRDREATLERVFAAKLVPEEARQQYREVCLYSYGSTLDTNGFAKVVSALEASAPRSPSSIKLPHGVMPTGPVQVDESHFYAEVTKYAKAEGVSFDKAKGVLLERYAKVAK